MPEFFLDLLRTCDRVGDFLAQQFPMPVPHALHSGFHRGLGHPEFLTQLRVGFSTRFARLVILQALEQRRLATRGVFLAQAVQRGLKDRLRPPPLKDLIRRQFIHRLQQVTLFASVRIERNKHPPPPRFCAPALRRCSAKKFFR